MYGDRDIALTRALQLRGIDRQHFEPGRQPRFGGAPPLARGAGGVPLTADGPLARRFSVAELAVGPKRLVFRKMTSSLRLKAKPPLAFRFRNCGKAGAPKTQAR